MTLWLKDPKTNEASVSLTLLMISFLATVVAGVLNMTGIVATTSIFTELTYSCVALYFSRRFSFNGKSFSSEPAAEIEKKVDV